MGIDSEKEIINFQNSLFHFVSQMEQRGIPYAIIGGIAINILGFRRMTQDIDFTIILKSESQSKEFVDYLRSNKLYDIQTVSFISLDNIPDFIRLRLEKVPVDFLVANTKFLGEVVNRAVEKKVFERDVRIATPEDILILKLLADRPHDRVDIDALLNYHPRMDWPYIEKWCKEWEIEERLKTIRAEQKDS